MNRPLSTEAGGTFSDSSGVVSPAFLLLPGGEPIDYQALRTELTTDPVTLGYSGMTDTQAAAKLNEVARVVNRDVVQGYEIVGAIVSSDLSAIPNTVTGQMMIARLMLITSASGGVNIRNANTRQILTDLFSAASQSTKTALLALQTLTVSRATELGLGVVTVLDVTRARGNNW